MVINSNIIMMTIKNPYSILQIKPIVKSEITTDIKQLEKETILNLEHSKANNTVRAYKSDFRDFGIILCSEMDSNHYHQNQR